LSAQLDYHTFKLDETTDSWYNAGGAAVLAGGTGRNIGSEIDLTFNLTTVDGFNLEGGYSWFNAGGFIDSVIGAASTNSTWGYLQLLKNF
ncbi:MAG: alginate export family protein, partial [bacterium]